MEENAAEVVIDKQISKTEASQPQFAEETVFTIFTSWERRWIAFLTAFASMLSTTSSLIFFPAIISMANGLNITIDKVNLSITSYMVISGVFPLVLGNSADRFGRRPFYLVALTTYFAANLGLALQHSLPALVLLRMLQSAGISGAMSLGYGVVSDISLPAERGTFVGMQLMGPNLSLPLAPILGGVLTATLGWEWIFWFLCIMGAICLLLMGMTLPETCRSIIGNGSIMAKWVHRTPMSFFRPQKDDRNEREAAHSRPSETVKSPTIWEGLKLLMLMDMAIVFVSNGIYYTTYLSISAAISTLFVERYHMDELHASLMYLPWGVASVASTYIWGRVLNRDYAKSATEAGLSDQHAVSSNTDDFPLEKARLRSIFLVILATVLGMAGLGWAIEKQAHLAVPIVLEVIIGFSGSSLFVALGTLLTDLSPGRSSTTAGISNLVRCIMSAAVVAAQQPIIDTIGVGWCFTIYGLFAALCGPLLFLEMKRGPAWRGKRRKPR